MLTPDERDADVLAAWVDGEPCDRADVLAALASPEGRAYVFDLMALRRVVAVTSPTAASVPSRPSRRWSRLATTAAAAIVCIGSGYGLAQLAHRTTPVPPSVTEGESTNEPSAPQPTHVIRFETGVDWRETGGGN